MKFLSIDNESDALNVDKIIENGNIVFILVYMEGCGPCNMTRPEWAKIKTTIKDVYNKKDNVYVIDLNKDYLNLVSKIGNIDGFPTMKYIKNNGSLIENYDNERKLDNFVNWIESKISNIQLSNPNNLLERLKKSKLNFKSKSKKSKKYKKSKTFKKYKGGKWSRKYKMSINCKIPKGFSQKQYCLYGRNKK